MKTFICSFYESWECGAYEEVEYLITANTKSEALGFAMEAHQKGNAKCWDIVEVNTTSVNATYISGRCS